MNRKQREKNRKTAAWLKNTVCICTRCGERGAHFVVLPIPIYGIRELDGFWTCSDLYDPVTGKRK